MDEDFLDVTESSKKVGIILVLAIILIIVIGYFLVFKKFYFSLKTVELELGRDMSQDIKDYVVQDIENVSEWKIDLSKVRENEVGTYTYTVTYNNTTKKGKFKVVDKTAPEFTLQELVIEEGETDYYLGDFLETCEDYSKPCLVTLKNTKDEEKFSKIGEYTIDIVVRDLHGNKKNGKATLKVVEKGTYVDPKSLDLEYTSNSKGVEDFKGTRYETLDKALKQGSEDAEMIINEISTIDLEQYVKTNYEDYRLIDSEIIELYNKSNYIIGYSIELTISNGKEKTVYVEKSKVPVVAPTTNSDDEEE